MGFVFAMSIPGLVVLLVVLAALERFGLWAGCRSRLTGRAARTSESLSGTAIEELGAFFYAGKRAELEHRKTELVLPHSETSGEPPAGALILRPADKV